MKQFRKQAKKVNIQDKKVDIGQKKSGHSKKKEKKMNDFVKQLFKNKKNRKYIITFVILFALLITGLSGQSERQKEEKKEEPKVVERVKNRANREKKEEKKVDAPQGQEQSSTAPETANSGAQSLADVPAYTNQDVYVINNNMPFFTDGEKQDKNSRIELSNRDSLGRCGVAKAVLDRSMFPKVHRKDISSVYPTGWEQRQYGNVYLYNRSHLIAYSLSGMNDEPRNLVTGTSYMNQDVMVDYEMKVKDYAERTGNHVVYRITPDFKGNDLLCHGIEMEAWSVEDGGQLHFNVYVYNVQPGVALDYATGDSSSSDYIQNTMNKQTNQSSTNTVKNTDVNQQMTFVANTSTKKFHLPECKNAGRISARNRQEITSTISQMEANGYEPAKCCIH